MPTNLESSWAPVDELDGALGLDGGDGGVDVLGDNITTVQHAAGHVFTVTWITLNHLVGWLSSCSLVPFVSQRRSLVGPDLRSVGVSPKPSARQCSDTSR